ncbi:hypothetical protein [Marinobacter orientalis]|uniref:Uncharacterized protein n=1 Tax=Marinobacter orientalis TaxID=1928859 RepID=A0A7Y0WTM5_9GAMM|nr:hypothetical protein [Marinobacter orientalis]NMT65022.1 hypothetical protein [Marinobacter orientalis]TGX48086.1 hypothetical protein DIT72_15810 [Marinobacter orientalis]
MTIQTSDTDINASVATFDEALEQLALTHQSDPLAPNTEVLEAALHVMKAPGGLDALYARVPAIEAKGVFANSDWDHPTILRPALAVRTLRQGAPAYTCIEALSELRLLAVAMGDYLHPGISAEQARNFLTQVTALNLDLLSGQMSEADRERPQGLGHIVNSLYQFLLNRLGYESILESLVDEVERLLAQRPIQTDSIKQMVSQIAKCLFDPQIETSGMHKAARLVSALFGPTRGCRDDPGFAVYSERLAAMDDFALTEEAQGFASAMHGTGMVSPYHPMLLRHLRAQRDDLIPLALGLSITGNDVLQSYRQIVLELIDQVVHPETCQAVYGLAMFLERGSLFTPPVASGLWRQLQLKLCPAADAKLSAVFGNAHPPRVYLLAGVLSLLGQPLGVGQGNNPTCQSVIGLSMWSFNDADFLLQLVAWAARDDDVIMRFEGQTITSQHLEAGLAKEPPTDVDPVSLILAPHLDRIYGEMGRLCGVRDDDLHRWINPEMYGWWVGHGFLSVINRETGKIHDYEDFIRRFYACYHPYYNGNLPVIHPQPAGIAVTDSGGRFVGRHAITIIRVNLDRTGEMRIYFFNPNNDSGQDWGQGISCSTESNGERHGEASLPFAEFASRLCVFHYDMREVGDMSVVPETDVTRAVELGRTSWAAGYE